MWAYKNAFEMPADREERLRRRAHFDYPITVDRMIGAGAPPSQRIARRLRQRGHLSPLDKALSFFYWTWEIEPHLVIGWIRWSQTDDFAAAAGPACRHVRYDPGRVLGGAHRAAPAGSRRSSGG